MRLIDVEKMIIKIPAELPERQRLRILNIFRESIEQTPTVEAIPIEWLEQIAEKISPATIEIDIPHNLLVFTSKRFVEVLTELWRRHFSPDQIADGEWVRRQKDEDN